MLLQSFHSRVIRFSSLSLSLLFFFYFIYTYRYYYILYRYIFILYFILSFLRYNKRCVYVHQLYVVLLCSAAFCSFTWARQVPYVYARTRTVCVYSIYVRFIRRVRTQIRLLKLPTITFFALDLYSKPANMSHDFRFSANTFEDDSTHVCSRWPRVCGFSVIEKEKYNREIRKHTFIIVVFLCSNFPRRTLSTSAFRRLSVLSNHIHHAEGEQHARSIVTAMCRNLIVFDLHALRSAVVHYTT